jgi:hypothetical protein
MKMGIFEAKSALIERVGWMAPPALRYAVQGCAPLRRRESKWRVRRTTGRRRQIGWSMAFYLKGKISVDTNDPSPKEATEMSRDIKYIGYVENEIADSISSSGLCGVDPGTID